MTEIPFVPWETHPFTAVSCFWTSLPCLGGGWGGHGRGHRRGGAPGLASGGDQSLAAGRLSRCLFDSLNNWSCFALSKPVKHCRLFSLIILEHWNWISSLDGHFNIFNQITWTSEQKTRWWEVNSVANGTSGSLFIWDLVKIILYIKILQF